MTIEHIEKSIADAVAGKSNLTPELLSIRGFSTPTIRMLFNNLCNTGKPITYLEIGLFCGASFCASFNENCTSVGVEDHSQDFSEGFDKVKQELKDNVEAFSGRGNDVKVHYADCFNMDKSVLPKIDIYSFDGFHSFDTQYKALPEFLDYMKDKFVFLCDDYSWGYVKEGTDKAMYDLTLSGKIKIEAKWVLGEGCHNHPIWHNSVAVYLINKL